MAVPVSAASISTSSITPTICGTPSTSMRQREPARTLRTTAAHADAEASERLSSNWNPSAGVSRSLSSRTLVQASNARSPTKSATRVTRAPGRRPWVTER